MKVKAISACIGFILIPLLIVSCATGISQDAYNELSGELEQTKRELAQARTDISGLQTTLAEAGEELALLQSELADYRANPPVLEVDFIDTGEIVKLRNLRVSNESSAEGTYIIECDLELTGDLPGLTNVVDVELYILDRFIDSDRWIDISSTGFATTKSKISIDTGLIEFIEPIKLRIIPSFKVFGA